MNDKYYTIGEYLNRKLRPGLSIEEGEKLKAAAVKLSTERGINIKRVKGHGIRYRLVALKFKESILIDVFNEFEI